MIRPIQYLRGLAALMVVWHHSLNQVTGLSAFIHLREFGTSGVDLFFVISGFIMVVTTTEKPLTAGRFFALRIVRVVPLYWLVTLLMVGCAIAAPHLLKTLQFTPEALAKSLLFIPYYSLSFPSYIWPLLVPGWTLDYEMFFYLLFAISLTIPATYRLGSLVATLIALVAAGYVAQPINPVAYVYTSPLLLEFGAGAVIGSLWMKRRLQIGLPASIAAMLAGASLLYLRGEFSGYSQMLGAILMVIGCLQATIPSPHDRLLLALGDASYSIYLTHLFALGGLRVVWMNLSSQPSPASAVAFMVVALVICATAGWIWYRLIERPLTSRLRWMLGRDRRRVPAGRNPA